MGWFVTLVIFVLAMLFVYFHPDERKGRRYKAQLALRERVFDDGLVHQFFSVNDMAPDIPGRVRRAFAKYMDYEPERMLPDDDLAFFWNELDIDELVRDLETDFGIEIGSEDMLRITDCTIRAFSELVARKLTAMQRSD